MRNGKRGLTSAIACAIAVFTIAICLAPSSRAQDLSSQPGLKAFAAEYVAAINAKDAQHILSLYLPKSQACITPANRDYYDGLMVLQLSDSVPADYRLTVTAPDENNLKAFPDGSFPAHPTHEMHIDYQKGEDSTTIVFYLVRVDGRWLGDFPCASDAQIQEFHDDLPARKIRDAHYKSLADQLEPPLRAELITLLRQHKTGQATTRYKDATGQDYKTAIFVIHALKQESAAPRP